MRSMLTGRKAAGSAVNEPAAEPNVEAATSVVLGVVALALVSVAALSRLPAKGVPTAPLDPVYVKECGNCHIPYPPSLAPAATWKAVMDGLADHFGENPSLDPMKVVKIRDWLAETRATLGHARRKPARAHKRARSTKDHRNTRLGAESTTNIRTPSSSRKRWEPRAHANLHADAETARFDPQSIANCKEAKPSKKTVIALYVVAGSAPWAAAEGAARRRRPSLKNTQRRRRPSDPCLSGFSGERGRVLFFAEPGAGKSDTPSCTTCHTKNPKEAGRTRQARKSAPWRLARKPTGIATALKPRNGSAAIVRASLGGPARRPKRVTSSHSWPASNTGKGSL